MYSLRQAYNNLLIAPACIFTLFILTHARLQKVLSEEVLQLWRFFLFFILDWWGEEGSKYRLVGHQHGPLAKRHLNGVSLAGRWWPNMECWIGSFVIFQRIRTSIAKEPYIFVIFQGWGPDPLSPLWIRACNTCVWQSPEYLKDTNTFLFSLNLTIPIEKSTFHSNLQFCHYMHKRHTR